MLLDCAEARVAPVAEAAGAGLWLVEKLDLHHTLAFERVHEIAAQPVAQMLFDLEIRASIEVGTDIVLGVECSDVRADIG